MAVAEKLIQSLEKKIAELIELSNELNRENRQLKLRTAEPEILLAMLLFGGGVAIVNEQAKTRKTTAEPFFKELRNFLKKSKYFTPAAWRRGRAP